MAAAYSTAATAPLHLQHRSFPNRILDPRKQVVLIFCIFTSSKPTKRKNYLRQKILRTLRKPFFPPHIQERNELENREIQDSENSGNSESGNKEMQGVEVLREVEISTPPVVIVDGNVGKFDKQFYLKYGVWLVGAFIFQTVCAVWIFGSADSENKNGILNGNREIPVREVGGNGTGDSRKKFTLNVHEQMSIQNGVIDSVVHLDKVEMERKIDEIRAMAREVREKERLESKNIDLDGEDDNDNDVMKIVKSGIEEEVDNRLLKLRRKMENERYHMPIGSVDHLSNESRRKDGFGERELNQREADAALVFEKKYKFKDFPSYQGNKPEGFPGLDDYSVGKSSESGIKETEDNLLRNVNGGNDAVGFDTKKSDAVDMVDTVKSKGSVELTGSAKSPRRKLEKDRGTRKQVKGRAVAKRKETDGSIHLQ